ncbi:hypothetical protein L873DRAFT_1818891 [Choiromyces venosus 120613-1]|uniref:Uncharacterized protein n=1 Tax=Choiromyces venosus 120613-1 TaxID=1336337 RepID=A0A3N4J0R3_9PEZI|nr:hypothetical protein L873DRAFT_1818891 [Choiromyces venosus 120613-1]
MCCNLAHKRSLAVQEVSSTGQPIQEISSLDWAIRRLENFLERLPVVGFLYAPSHHVALVLTRTR